MSSFRSKPVGWRNESYRHYLAAKGVSSKKHKFFALIRAKTGEGEWVHDDEKGESYFHVPGKRGDGFYGSTIVLRDGKERIEMQGPWHGTASSMRKETGVEVYDAYEPEWWVRKGLMSEEEAKRLRKVEDTSLKEALKGVSREKDPIVARDTEGGEVRLSGLRLNLPDDQRVLRKKLRTGWTTGSDYKESLFADEWVPRKDAYPYGTQSDEMVAKPSWGKERSKPLKDETRKSIVGGMKNFFSEVVKR